MNKKFAWGRVIQRHAIGPYEIVEYAERGADNHKKYPSQETGRILFHPYVKKVDTNHSFESLDAALAGAIAYRNEGINHQADIYFMRGILWKR